MGNGCEELPSIENKRPLGIDRLEQICRADAENRLMELFLVHCRQTGYTSKQCFLNTPAYGTVDPENLEAILTKFSEWSFGPRRKIIFPAFGDGIFTQEDEAWKHSREILRPQFAHRQYEDLQVFEEPIGDLLLALPHHGTVDLQPLFFRFTLDVATAFLFGESVHSLRPSNGPQEQTFAGAFTTAQSYIASRFRLGDLYWLIGGKTWRDSCAQVRKFADQIIDQNLSNSRMCQKDSRYVFLTSLAKACPDRSALRGQIINNLVAGRDTAACLLSWTFFLLLRHPELYAYALHRRADLYGLDADCFRPDRWDEDLPLFKDRTTQNYGYMPFNGGLRMCLGMDFALTEAAYLIVRILPKYPRMILPEGQKIQTLGVEKQTMTLVLQITDGCKVDLSSTP
ncbi:cytochrome P450 alkane hydroxylase [Xylariaceae sp. FL1272]|nr:cytochrome P450 alkane hydroxylase [Xylariaceae sp. FL1272]